MRKNGTFLAIGVVCLIAVAGAAPGAAQEKKEPAGPSVRPMELYGCTYKEGKGFADLEKATAAWNAWMDKTGQNDYWAFYLTPYYHSEELKYDILWAGGWRTGADMGRSLGRYVSEGGAAAAGFAAAVSCTAVTNFALMDLSEAPNPPESGPITFSNCTVAKGRKFPDALAAVKAWIAYEKEHGIEGDDYILFPALGESSKADYSFKWVTSATWDSFGKGYDQYGTGGGWKTADELFDGLLDCDSSRLYVSRRIRNMAKP